MEILLIFLLFQLPILLLYTIRIKNYKPLRYLVNTILFVVIWCIPAFIFVGISLSVSGTRPSAIAGVGGIVAIIISYRLVKRINKSNLWSRLFYEAEVEPISIHFNIEENVE